MDEPNDFVKASRYDTAGHRHNRAVFVRWLRARPIAAVSLSGLFAALGIVVLLAANPGRRPVWIVAMLAFGAAAWLLAVTFRRESK
jgi:hypothetical protein